MKHFVLMVFALLLSDFTLAEGTKELRPSATDNGSLLLMPSYSPFGIYGASSKNQIKIRIAALSETIYFGFNNKNGIDATGSSNDNGAFVPNIPFRILSPSGQVVYGSVIPDLGQTGNIATWSQAVAGPAQMGNTGGYNAFKVAPKETGNYVLEFNPAAMGITRLNLHLFDVTVSDANNKPVLGRLHSQGWQISTGSYTNPFNGKVYPYDGSSAVYKVDFNGMQPWVFVINFNSTGTANTGNPTEDRKSKIGNYTYSEYEVFLNPPDETLYPTQRKTLTLDGSVQKKDCLSADFCLNFTSNSEGDLKGFIDLNNNGTFDPTAGEISFEDRFDGPGTKCIYWNGKDANGNLATGNFQVVATLGFGITHLPLYDVEHNRNGYKVSIVRPAGATPPLLYWDDSYITDGTALDAKVNLSGCLSAYTGCHRWINRGSINDPTALDKQETINTWWYSTIANTTLLVSIPRIQKVQLSFDPLKLVKGDTTVCRGDSILFYIYNDGTHFDPSRYSYEWYFNTAALTPDIRQQKQQILQESEIVVKATDKTFQTCVSYDTLHVHIVDPVTLTGQTTMPPCGSKTGAIQVQLLSGPPGKQFYWQEFPGLNSGSLSNLSPGTYHLHAMDPAYPHCAADTSFTVRESGGIIIDTVKVTGTSCFQNTGTAAVFMEDAARIYEYSWDNSSFSKDTVKNLLAPGAHSVLVRETGTGCTDQKVFRITAATLNISATSVNEICHNGQGEIALTLPATLTNYTVTWNGTTGNDTLKSGLSSGVYKITVQSASYPGCIFDTTVIITNTDRKIIIKSLLVQPGNCQMPAGSAEITMMPGNYLYSWDNGPLVTTDKMSGLAAGKHTIHITETGSTCATDTAFEISILPYSMDVTSKNEICGSGTGSIHIIPDDPSGTGVIWQDGSTDSFTRNNLHAGSYYFTVFNKNYPACRIDRQVTIRDTSYQLKADFTYAILNPDSMGKRVIGFTNRSSLYKWSTWTFSDGTFSNETNPEHVFSQDVEYTVTLHITDSNGCWGEARKSFWPFRLADASCSGIALPNVFSPNGDGMNDDIGILGYAPKVELKIFNRWGEVIFRTEDVSYRWDGYYRGEKAPVDVYPYILDWSCPEGDNFTRHHKVGDITLVR